MERFSKAFAVHVDGRSVYDIDIFIGDMAPEKMIAYFNVSSLLCLSLIFSKKHSGTVIDVVRYFGFCAYLSVPKIFESPFVVAQCFMPLYEGHRYGG